MSVMEESWKVVGNEGATLRLIALLSSWAIHCVILDLALRYMHLCPLAFASAD